MGATLGAAFGTLCHLVIPMPAITIGAFAMIGMAAMVGSATGAAMTAVTMIFEMTRDYDIVMPMIVAVAVAIGVRRVLCSENIYTLKLVARHHFIPKALHANMFLVRPAGDVMSRDFLVMDSDMDFDAFLRQPEHHGRMRHVIITKANRIAGVLRVNTSLRLGLEGSSTGVKLGEVMSRRFIVAREGDIMFGVIGRMWRKNASMIVVVRGRKVPHKADILGIITKEHVADSVAASVKPYAGGEATPF